jgi:hypothetical protein
MSLIVLVGGFYCRKARNTLSIKRIYQKKVDGRKKDRDIAVEGSICL